MFRGQLGPIDLSVAVLCGRGADGSAAVRREVCACLHESCVFLISGPVLKANVRASYCACPCNIATVRLRIFKFMSVDAQCHRRAWWRVSAVLMQRTSARLRMGVVFCSFVCGAPL